MLTHVDIHAKAYNRSRKELLKSRCFTSASYWVLEDVIMQLYFLG